ncbi:MAG: phospholipid carrier-dependent glycosyltransferase [Curvibacter sp.]|nr:MAG: phospholipid carrier-dependent glycosyltransferase [Curvibacter sp.]
MNHRPEPWHRSWRGWLAVGVFLLGVLRMVEWPGIYMDGVNPDYAAARMLHPALDNPVWLPTFAGLPLLGGIYHGMQNTYVGLPIFWLTDFSVMGLRLAQALFGAISVMLVYRITCRLSGRPWLALLAALGLACDAAFVMSFRTQNYIIQGGMTWLLLSVDSLLTQQDRSPQEAPGDCFMRSGVFAGLAIYGYFVLGFFVPALAVAVLALAAPGRRRHSLGRWALGVGLGLMPYVLGYASMMVALGGPKALLVHMEHTVRGLAPMVSGYTLTETLSYLLSIARLALSDGGNEFMMFRQGVSGPWAENKLDLLALAMLLGASLLIWRGARIAPLQRIGAWLILMLPISYGASCMVFGHRLWAHHFTVLVPLLYLGLACTLALALDTLQPPDRSTRGGPWLAGALCLALLGGNIAQQQRVFDALARTGGVGLMSHNINLMARQALDDQGKAVYVLPEWGFLMPMVFLTGNRVPIRTGLDTRWLERFRGQGTELRLAVWNEDQLAQYRTELQRLQLPELGLQTYRQLDGPIAFYVLRAQLP